MRNHLYLDEAESASRLLRAESRSRLAKAGGGGYLIGERRRKRND